MDTQALLSRALSSTLALFRMPVQALICSVGMRTLGSAELAAIRPFRKAHLITEVAHVPAAIRPVALATFAFALLVLVGAIPMAVIPYV